MSAIRLQIMAAAREYLGVPFLKGGRSKQGIDCVGLLVLVGRDIGLDIQDTTDYTFNPEVTKFADVVYSQSVRVPLNPILIGSIAILKQSLYPMHTGIIGQNADGLTIINANLKKRMVVEQPMSDWQNDLTMLRDYKGI